MRATSDKEMQAVSRLDGPARFKHFVKRVVDSQAAWGLWHEGWAMMVDDHGARGFPLWPAKEYAELHREDDWAAFEAREIPLEDILGALLPKLAEQGVRAAVFPVPSGKSVFTTSAELEAAVREEMAAYEFNAGA